MKKKTGSFESGRAFVGAKIFRRKQSSDILVTLLLLVEMQYGPR